MRCIPDYQNRRTAEYDARDLLIRSGYGVARVTGRQGTVSSRFHLIAWHHRHGIFFIRLGSMRMHRQTIRENIQNLSDMHRTGEYPGELQYWIRQDRAWKRYQICQGGAMLIRNPLA